jgi:hypothetical protein
MKKIKLGLSFFLLFFISCLNAQVNLTSGLVAYYPFNGNANDSSGNNNNPSFNNATLTTNRFGNANSAYNFNGTNNYMRIPNSSSLNMGNQISICTWVKPKGFYQGQCRNNMLLIKGDADFLQGSYSLRFADPVNGCSATNNDQNIFYGVGAFADTPIVALNQWYSVVNTYDGVTAKMYVNCILVKSTIVSYTTFTNNYDLFFGRLNNSQYPYWLNGDLDEVRIYNRAINQDEVNVYGGFPSQTNINSGLMAYYPFNGNANDSSGNNNNPSFNNATLTTDKFGNANSAYHFNGSNSYIRIPNSSTLNTSNKLSMAMWVRPTGFYAGTCHGNSVLMKGDGDNVSGKYLVRFDDAIYTGTNCNGGAPDPNHQLFYGSGIANNYNSFIQQNQWYYVVITDDGVTTKLYINCELKSSAVSANINYTNSFDLFFGRNNTTQFPYWLNGDLDEIRLYNRAISQEEVSVLGGCTATPVTPSCNNWLNTASAGSYVSVGDLDIVGNKLTIETKFNKTAAAIPSGSNGLLVSKATNSANNNYTLTPNGCSITTTNGQFSANESCPLSLNKIYHAAMVYDGSSLKFYRNGFLQSSTPASGNLVTNNLSTALAQNSPTGTSNSFLGYMNEVRFWNIARTPSQLQTFMNIPIPTPTTQPGLLAYYSFDNLTNKQGNTLFNCTLNGGAVITATNSVCTFTTDSCGGIICPTFTGNIAGTTTALQNASVDPLITFSSNGGAKPYTFTYNINNGSTTSGNLSVATTGTNNTVNVVQSNTTIGNFTYTLLGVKDANNCNGVISSNYQATINVVSNTTILPDLKPVIQSSLSTVNYTSPLHLRIRVAEVAGAATNGSPIEVRLQKTPNFNFTWNATLTSVTGGTVNNNLWTHSVVGNHHIFKLINPSTNIISANGSLYIGLVGTYNSNGCNGNDEIQVTIKNRSGGETNFTNNKTTKTITYYN